MNAPTLARDELDVVAEISGGPSFPACSCFAGPGTLTVSIVSYVFDGPDLATLTSEVRVLGAMPELAAIALDMSNRIAPVWMFLLVFEGLFVRS